MQQKSIIAPAWRRVRGAGGLGAALADVRKARGMTQAQLAQALDVTRMTASRMESGENQTLERITRAFSFLGYDLVVVPRGARVTVEVPDASAVDVTESPR